MSSNKHTLHDKSTLLKGKLEALAKKLQDATSSSSLQTKEEYLFESIRILQSFYKDMKEPLIQPDIATPDTLPNVDDYNELWETLLDDLTIVFSELENIESLSISNFNFITTEGNRLRSRMKGVSSKLGDFILYSVNPLNDTLYFKDSFNDLSKVDNNSSLLNEEQCFINQDEGILTLPIDTDVSSSISVVGRPVINSSSNGKLGNNEEISVPHNGDISAILDRNADTWFEYERVEAKSSSNTKALKLDLTLNLGTPSVVNNIVINPNNFGTKIALKILSIETSLDGVSYISIKDDIPISTYEYGDEENVFSLAPATSKFAGQGIYTFTPRKIKYVRVVFAQDEPYIINTISGEKLRYAIGLRDIDINGYTYLAKGELISKAFTLNEPIRKVILDTTQNPAQQTELVDVNWFISPDDGMKWFQIQPKNEGANSGIQSSVPEIINFNSADENAVITESPTTSLRVKCALSRDASAFTSGSSTLKKTTVSNSELHSVPSSVPFKITLEKKPVDGTVSVINPMYGSRGMPEAQYVVATEAQGQQTFYMPKQFINLGWPEKKVTVAGTTHTEPVSAGEWMHILVEGEEWAHASAPMNTLSGAGKVYTYNTVSGVLAFGNGTNATNPGDLASVTMYFNEERLFPDATENAHSATLVFPTSSNKAGVIISRKDNPVTTSEVIAKSVKTIRLQHSPVTSRGLTLIANLLESADADMSFTTRASFFNGSDELTSLNHYSVDMDNGIIYLGHPTPADRDVTIEYEYAPVYMLKEDEWDFGSSDGQIKDKVLIKDSAWKTKTVRSETLPTTQNILAVHFKNFNIAKGSLVISASDGEVALSDATNPFLREVTFWNGVQELGLGTMKKATEAVPSLAPGVGNVATFTLNESITTDTTKRLSFSDDTYFITEDAALDDVGDWTVNRVTRVVSVVMPSSATVSNHGTEISYWYPNPNRGTDGLYSVDYANGILYVQRPINPSNSGTYVLTASYGYTDFYASYRIARRLDNKDYSVDITNGEVIISEREILSNILIPKATAVQPYYLVNYDSISTVREDIQGLEKLFSPLVKDYVLKVIPESRLV